MTPILQCDGVSVRVGDRYLLRDVSLDVQPGEIVALAGPNGAGKSTLMAVLAGDILPTSGVALLDGRRIERYRPRELSLRRAVLPQQSIVQFAFTAREIVEMGRSPHGQTDDHDAAVDRAIARTDVTQIAGRIFPTLSVGEQARVSMARVLAQEAPLLLLDEPTAALDLRHQQMVMDVARNLAQEGVTIVVIVHDLNLAAGFADRIVLLREGMVAAAGTPWEVMAEPLLERVFECRIQVTAHPLSDRPLVLPLMTGGVAMASRQSGSNNGQTGT
jgi:iron complex transport system ATP-binding protein